MSTKSASSLFWSSEPEPHVRRRKEILKAHPEVRDLFGPSRVTFVAGLAIVVLQLGTAWMLKESSIGMILGVAFLVGSILVHAMHVVIHDCAHNLAFKTSTANRLLAIVTNIPGVFPTAISFQKYHLLHHRYQGSPAFDADLPSPMEAKIVGNRFYMKVLWLAFFILIEGVLRPARLKDVKLWDRWTAGAALFQVLCMAVFFYFAGSTAFLYLVLSAFFAVGLHPIGGRWIQEHFVFREGQETYSYYGIANITSLNVGYHNEHHDFMMVAWPNLPKLKKLAPEFYDSLYSHTSYIRLFFRFIVDKKIDLRHRVMRSDPAFLK